MPDAIWVDRSDELQALAAALQAQSSIGVDTEFLRERTFFPKLCLLQLSAAGKIWCVDTLRMGDLQPLMPVLTSTDTRKLIHAARQDLEALYLTGGHIVSPVFDTQIAAACIGIKPQIGYAELVKNLLDVTILKGQTRTDWSKRPLSPEQLDYAADDVLYLGDIAAQLTLRLRQLGREEWVREDCAALADKRLYEADPARSWTRLRGIAQLAPAPRARAKVIAMWRESLARDRDLPRAWILPDAAIFSIALANPSTPTALEKLQPMNAEFTATLLEALGSAARTDMDEGEGGPLLDLRPTPEQKITFERLVKIVDARAAELQISAEILAPRGELKALAMGARDSHALSGWRREQIGMRLLESVN